MLRFTIYVLIFAACSFTFGWRHDRRAFIDSQSSTFALQASALMTLLIALAVLGLRKSEEQWWVGAAAISILLAYLLFAISPAVQ